MVFGTGHQLTLIEANIYLMIQQRTALSLTEEGRKQMKNEWAVETAINMLEAEEQAEARGEHVQTPWDQVVDPARMSEEEMAAWVDSMYAAIS